MNIKSRVRAKVVIINVLFELFFCCLWFCTRVTTRRCSRLRRLFIDSERLDSRRRRCSRRRLLRTLSDDGRERRGNTRLIHHTRRSHDFKQSHAKLLIFHTQLSHRLSRSFNIKTASGCADVLSLVIAAVRVRFPIKQQRIITQDRSKIHLIFIISSFASVTNHRCDRTRRHVTVNRPRPRRRRPHIVQHLHRTIKLPLPTRVIPRHVRAQVKSIHIPRRAQRRRRIDVRDARIKKIFARAPIDILHIVPIVVPNVVVLVLVVVATHRERTRD
mmetsp:Transcript_3284/g.11837  ORF Transcript_3284/g.11837 Transcript_3284/m.11837 type:complete len:273 (-) Transcript_3284:63-881(-)